MSLCPECCAKADSEMIRARIAIKGIPDREDNKWAQVYNREHKKHSAPAKRTRKKAMA